MKKVKLFEEYILSEKKTTLTWNDNDSTNKGKYIVEGSLNEDIFRTYNKVVGYEFNKFKEAYLELHKDNEVIYDKKDDVSYGLRRSEKEPYWKYFHDNFKLYHSERDRDVLGLINFKKMASKSFFEASATRTNALLNPAFFMLSKLLRSSSLCCIIKCIFYFIWILFFLAK